MKLTVTIITLNEEEGIRDCLQSVRWADEIVLMDSGSVDKTVDLAREFTDRVFQEKNWEGYGRQKNKGALHARNDWVLNVDADEVLSCDLKEEIERLMEKGPECPMYRVARKNFIGDRWIRFGGWYPDRIVRLYNRKRASFSETSVHEGIRARGGEEAGSLKGHLIHKTYASLQDYFARQEHYASLSARDMILAGRRAHSRDRLLRPFFSFFKSYLLKLGFLEGYYGLAIAWGQALYTYRKYVILRDANCVKREA